MIRSINHVTIVSAVFPIVADTTPRINAITALNVAAQTPIIILIDNPLTVLANISLPSQSVPNGYFRQGGIFFLEKSVTFAASLQKLPPIQTVARNTTAITSQITSVFLRFHLLLISFPARLLASCCLSFKDAVIFFIFPHPLCVLSGQLLHKEYLRSDFRQR